MGSEGFLARILLYRDVCTQSKAITGQSIPHHQERTKERELVKQSSLQPSPNAGPQECLRDPGCFFYPPLIPENVPSF